VVKFVVEVLLFLIGILLIFAAGVLIKYYRWLKKVQKEYKEAREVVQDIILSFNRQFEGEANNLALVAYKVEGIHSKVNNYLKIAEEANKKGCALERDVGALIRDKEVIYSRLEEIDKKVCDAVTSKETLTVKLSNIEEQIKQLSIAPETKIEAVIPIKKEKALAQLTETELMVLEYLALEGSKTAPEIKEKIKLSREHTARLMKKLYEEGYLERDTGKIPFKYSVKREMGNLLVKKEEHPA